MEFTNEIFFNKKLIQNETVLITYSGKLYKEYSAEISIVYGFGENWDYTSEVKMQEKENGFEAAITLKNYDTFNFCFKNNFNIWDNNSGFNYIAAIEPAKVQETQDSTEEQKIEPEFIEEIQEPQENKNLENINTFEDATSKTEDVANNTQEISEKETQDAVEEAFNNLLNSIMSFEENDINKNVNLENGFGLQSVDEIKETDFTSCDDIFQELYNELSNIETPKDSNIQNIANEEAQNESNTSTLANESADLETLLDNFSKKQEQKNNTITSEELDNLMDNILNSIIDEEKTLNNISQIAETSSEEQSEKTFELSGLPTVKKQSSIEDFIDKCIDGTYYFFRNIWNGCKKVGVLIKNKTQELLGEDK